MAQVRVLKINADGHPEETNPAADDITLVSFSVTGGGPVLSGTGLDLNNQDIVDIQDLVFVDPSTGTINQTAGSLVVDNIMAKDRENLLSTAGSVSFPVITDVAGQVDAFRLPALAGTPSATPTSGGEGHLVWDSANNIPYAWNGSSWQNLSLATEALSVQTPSVADGAIAARDVLFVSGADTVSPAIATVQAEAEAVVGFAVASAADTAAVEIQSDGVVSGFSGLTPGKVQFLSTSTAGAIQEAVPSTSGDNIVKVGVARSASAVQVMFQYLGRRS
jgi:hypothetical protein